MKLEVYINLKYGGVNKSFADKFGYAETTISRMIKNDRHRVYDGNLVLIKKSLETKGNE